MTKRRKGTENHVLCYESTESPLRSSPLQKMLSWELSGYVIYTKIYVQTLSTGISPSGFVYIWSGLPRLQVFGSLTTTHNFGDILPHLYTPHYTHRRSNTNRRHCAMYLKVLSPVTSAKLQSHQPASLCTLHNPKNGDVVQTEIPSATRFFGKCHDGVPKKRRKRGTPNILRMAPRLCYNRHRPVFEHSEGCGVRFHTFH